MAARCPAKVGAQRRDVGSTVTKILHGSRAPETSRTASHDSPGEPPTRISLAPDLSSVRRLTYSCARRRRPTTRVDPGHVAVGEPRRPIASTATFRVRSELGHDLLERTTVDDAERRRRRVVLCVGTRCARRGASLPDTTSGTHGTQLRERDEPGRSRRGTASTQDTIVDSRPILQSPPSSTTFTASRIVANVVGTRGTHVTVAIGRGRGNAATKARSSCCATGWAAPHARVLPR